MKHEYHEGPEALDRFEKGMAKLFQMPKPTPKAEAKPEKKEEAKRPSADPKR